VKPESGRPPRAPHRPLHPRTTALRRAIVAAPSASVPIPVVRAAWSGSSAGRLDTPEPPRRLRPRRVRSATQHQGPVRAGRRRAWTGVPLDRRRPSGRGSRFVHGHQASPDGTMDLDTLNAQLPDEVIAGDGTMVGYAEIFPWAGVQVNRDGAGMVRGRSTCVRPGAIAPKPASPSSCAGGTSPPPNLVAAGRQSASNFRWREAEADPRRLHGQNRQHLRTRINPSAEPVRASRTFLHTTMSAASSPCGKRNRQPRARRIAPDPAARRIRIWQDTPAHRHAQLKQLGRRSCLPAPFPGRPPYPSPIGRRGDQCFNCACRWRSVLPDSDSPRAGSGAIRLARGLPGCVPAR